MFVLFCGSAALIAAAGCGGSINSSSGGGGGGGGGSCTPAPATSTSASCPVLTPVAGAAFAGKVMAGQLPVSGATVQLYAAGNSGNGSAPAAVLTTPASTNSTGSFAVPAGYSCPSAQAPLYLIAKGGQAGGGSANSALWLMTALGPCSNIAAGTSFAIDEATTVGAVWALASFMSSGGNVGASCTNTAGLNNAFVTANELVNSATGAAPGAGLPATLTVPVNKLNTLANALASCTQSSGGSACSSLFSTVASGSTTPANTLDAALDMAHLPGSHAAAIYALASGNSVFSPALAAAPPDLMLHNTVTGGGMASPASVSIAASGDVWVSNYFNTISEFSPAGATLFPAGISGSGINQSYGMALDANGNAWIANEQTNPDNGNGDVAELNSSGAVLESNLTTGGIDFPIAVAADANGNIWFADYGDSKVTVLSDTGTAVSSAPGWGGTSLAFPDAVAIDADHNAWVANQAGELPITKISPDGSTATNYECNCNGASGVATDRSGNVWIANYYGNTVSAVNTCGTLAVSGATGGGVDHPQGIAVDGSGTVWVTNFLSNSLAEIGGAASTTLGTVLSPAGGFGTDASILQPYGMAIDASGSIWVSNFGNNTLTQFIGVATPVKTPLLGPPQEP
jgi:streptogramin lyase